MASTKNKKHKTNDLVQRGPPPVAGPIATEYENDVTPLGGTIGTGGGTADRPSLAGREDFNDLEMYLPLLENDQPDDLESSGADLTPNPMRLVHPNVMEY